MYPIYSVCHFQNPIHVVSLAQNPSQIPLLQLMFVAGVCLLIKINSHTIQLFPILSLTFIILCHLMSIISYLFLFIMTVRPGTFFLLSTENL